MTTIDQDAAPAAAPERQLAWKFNSVDVRVASVRYRGLKPALLLLRSGSACELHEGRARIEWDHVAAFINVKSYTFYDLLLTQHASRVGVPVILDLCDNIFVGTYRSEKTIEPAKTFLEMSKYATVVTTTSEMLADIIRRHQRGNADVVCIPDGIETIDDLRAMYELCNKGRRLPIREAISAINARGRREFVKELPGMVGRYAARSIAHAKEAVAASSFAPANPIRQGGDVKTILWFGNHGAPHSNFGMLDLRIVQAALEQLAREIDIELIVVSNNQKKFEDAISRFNLKTRYVEWDPIATFAQVASADVVLLPNSQEEFSLCKSANRAVLALSLGVPVVATFTPSYTPLRGCMLFDDWYTSIRRYLTDRSLVDEHVTAAQAVLESDYSDHAILSHWQNLIRGLPQVNPPSPYKDAYGFYLGVVGDLEILQPLIEQSIPIRDVVVFIDIALVEQYPHVWEQLTATSRWLVSREELASLETFLKSLAVLVTASESNLRPHKLAHEITKLANSHGVVTLTLQHGFENIGITYSDDNQPIDKIRIAASKILTWGDASTYHPQITHENAAKCVAVGFPKRLLARHADIPELLRFSTNVGIFENLHWTRYSDQYRADFLNAMQNCARAFPNVGFIVRPHQAGMWLTDRYRGDRPTADNIVILDPAAPNSQHITARQLLPMLDAVITSPSTVAVDAAFAGVPVAVVGFEMDLENYAPLEILRSEQDWHALIRRVELADADALQLMRDNRDTFLRRVFVPGDPFENFVRSISAPLQPLLRKPAPRKPIREPQMETMRVFVGSDRSQALAVRVLEHSIRRHTKGPVEVIPMVDLDVREPKDPRQGQRTGFSFSRFCIPKLCGYTGKAIYMDADMLVFHDLAELWNIPFDGAKIVIQEDVKHQQKSTAKVGAPKQRKKQCAVMLIDCDRVDWDIDRIIDGLDDAKYDYEGLMNDLCILDESEIKYGVPFEWNSLEHFDASTRLIHYTDMFTQPWVSPLNKNGDLWLNEVQLMLADGTLKWRDIANEVRLGYFRPTILRDLRHRRKIPRPLRPLLDRWNSITDRRTGFEKHKDVYLAKRRRKKAIEAHERAVSAAAERATT